MSGKRYAKFLIPTLLVSAGVISLAYYFQKKNNAKVVKPDSEELRAFIKNLKNKKASLNAEVEASIIEGQPAFDERMANQRSPVNRTDHARSDGSTSYLELPNATNTPEIHVAVNNLLTSTMLSKFTRRRGNIKDQRMANFQDFHSLANERVNQFYEIDLEQREHTASDPEYKMYFSPTAEKSFCKTGLANLATLVVRNVDTLLHTFNFILVIDREEIPLILNESNNNLEESTFNRSRSRLTKESILKGNLKKRILKAMPKKLRFGNSKSTKHLESDFGKNVKVIITETSLCRIPSWVPNSL